MDVKWHMIVIAICISFELISELIFELNFL